MKTMKRLAVGAAVCTLAASAVGDVGAGSSPAQDQQSEVHSVPLYNGPSGEPVDEIATDEGYDGGISPRGTVSHQVQVKVVVDGAYRAAHPSWRDRVEDTIERADNRLYEVFDINLDVTLIDTWTSVSSNSCGDQIRDLDNVDRNGRDLVIGFTGRNITDAGGCAYPLGRYTVIVDQGLRNDWIVTRHEVSHLFGAQDRYLGDGAANPNHLDDLMERPYQNPNWWSAETPDGDRPIIRGNAGRFD